MKYSLMILLFMLSSRVMAAQFTSSIHSIDLGKSKESHLIRFDNGRVTFVRSGDSKLIEALVTTSERQEIVSVNVNSENTIIAVQSVADSDIDIDAGTWSDNPDPYQPAVVKNTNAALKIFNKMRKDYTKKGECYNRAHIWSYEEYQRSGFNSMKIFMFFTERYIRKYKFHWWFHVTPMTYIVSFKSPRTLDRRYTSGPRQTKTWSNVFVKSQRTCKKVEKFDDFWLNQQSQDCYHIHASMYYVIPRDLEKRDLTGKEKNQFSEKEIRRAYRNGFNKIDM